MIYPTIGELTKDEFNRYELALATAKCARLITNEYVRQREAAERSMTGNKETDRPLVSMIDREYRDEKAVKVAVSRISQGVYDIARLTPEELEEIERNTKAPSFDTPIYSEIPDMLPEDNEFPENGEESAEEAETASVEAAEEAVETVEAAEEATEEAVGAEAVEETEAGAPAEAPAEEA